MSEIKATVVKTAFSLSLDKKTSLYGKADKEIAPKLDELFRKHEKDSQEVGEITLTDCELSSFLVSVDVCQICVIIKNSSNLVR